MRANYFAENANKMQTQIFGQTKVFFDLCRRHFFKYLKAIAIMNKNQRKRFTAFVAVMLLAWLTPSSMMAQPHREIDISVDVKDGFLKTPLPDVHVSICRADSSVLVDSAKTSLIRLDDRLLYAVYSAKVTTSANRLLVHAQLKGYDDVWSQVNIGKQTEVEVPTLEMRKMRQVDLNEVVVQATRIKMFYRGDTIVYDASAFQLPQGSMLDDLIRQMPGVKMNEAGEIFVNGRKVDELLLGSRSFMGGNKKVLMENLPYYTVKNIKVYDKSSDKSMALGYDVDPKKYVMDVNLKEEYQRGYVANVEGAVGTEDRWLGRAFVLGFTDRLRLTLLGNVNNVNESRHIGQSGHWTPASMPRSMLTTRSAATEIDYHTKGEQVQETFSADYTSTTDVQEMRQRYEQFLMGSSPLSLSASQNRSGNKKVKLHNTLSLKKPLYLRTELDFNYVKRNGSFNSSFDQWDDALTASMRTIGMSEGKAWNLKGEVTGAFNVGKNKQHIDFYTMMQHDNDESQQASRYQTEQFTANTNLLTHNTNDIYNRSTVGFLQLGYGMPLGKDVKIGLTEQAQMWNARTHDYLYHPESLLLPSEMDMLTAITDPSNSYDSHRQMFENNVSISLYREGRYTLIPDRPFKIVYQCWSIGVNIPVRHESLDYQRGMLDTLATQNTLFLNTSASFRHVSEYGKRDFNINVSHRRSGVNLSDRITYRDDSQPLVVKLGNPNLKGDITSSFGIDFSNKGGGNQQQWHVGTSANIYHRQTAQSVSYNTETAVYTYQPMNVKGAYRLNAKFDFSKAIDNNRYWTWQTNADAGFNHSIDHSMFTGESQSHKNIVNTLALHDGAYIQYNKGALNVRATGDIRWQHSEGKMYDFETLNVTDFQYGLSARYTIPRLNTTLSADGNMYSRRGYGSSDLNTNDFIINASVSQPFCKGKLIASIEAFDLLHQLSSTEYMVNAQGRTETWYRSLPHYVMAHLAYHWNKNPKKK